METLLTSVAVALSPFAAVAALLVAVERIQRARAAVVLRQIALTDAIHRELGPIVSPWVARRPAGRWRVTIPARLDHPSLAAAVLDVVRREFTEPFDIVLTPAPRPRARVAEAAAPIPEGRFASWA